MTDYKQMQINSVTAHHVHSFATRTGRSDANALAVLVQDGYNHFMNSWSDRVSAPPPTEAETIAEKSAGGRGLNVHLPHDVIGALQATARAEKRSVSNLAKAIVAEGLARRRLASLDTGKVDVAQS
jgi:hypothetical protein